MLSPRAIRTPLVSAHDAAPSAGGTSTPTRGLPGASSSTRRGVPPTAFLSRPSAAQAASRSTPDRLGPKRFLDGLGVEAGETERREEPERHGPAVRQLEAGRGLERVRERVAEVELRPLAAVVRVAQAERRLERGRATHLLVERQLPDRLAEQKARLDDLGTAVRELFLRQRLERRGVDHRPRRPVEGADDVLRARQVDRRLAADRRVDLADERRRHRDPVDPAEVAWRPRSRRRRSCSRRRAQPACPTGRAGANARAPPATRQSSPARPARARGRRGRGRRARAGRPSRRSPPRARR